MRPFPTLAQNRFFDMYVYTYMYIRVYVYIYIFMHARIVYEETV